MAKFEPVVKEKTSIKRTIAKCGALYGLLMLDAFTSGMVYGVRVALGDNELDAASKAIAFSAIEGIIGTVIIDKVFEPKTLSVKHLNDELNDKSEE